MFWRNSNFQYVHFILGACHTPVEAHRKCMEAIFDRETALDAHLNRSWVKKIKDLYEYCSEFQAGSKEAHIAQARDELAFLCECRNRLETHIGGRPSREDYQQNQQLEWKLELKHRVENFLITTGYIPTDHYVVMRQHPEFDEIAAHIEATKKKCSTGYHSLEQPGWKDRVLLLKG